MNIAKYDTDMIPKNHNKKGPWEINQARGVACFLPKIDQLIGQKREPFRHYLKTNKFKNIPE